jgi:hypothetical protein
VIDPAAARSRSISIIKEQYREEILHPFAGVSLPGPGMGATIVYPGRRIGARAPG